MPDADPNDRDTPHDAEKSANEDAQNDAPDGAHADRHKYLVLAGVGLAFAIVAFVAWRAGWLSGPKLRAGVASARRMRAHAWAMPAFVLAYVALALGGLPAAPVTMAGGAIFGFVRGAILNWLGTTLGAAVGYALARWLGRGSLGGAIERLGRGAAGKLAKEHGFGAIFRLRLVPVMPQNAISIAAGLAGVRWWPYLLGSALGAVPGTLVYTYFANTLLGGSAGAKHHVTIELAVASVLLVVVSFAPTAVHRLRRGGGPAPSGA